MSAVIKKPELNLSAVELIVMKRRHIRQIMRIESQVYPRPWSAALFIQEIGRKGDRVYLVARLGEDVVGYGGLMVTGAEGHITTIAVDPEYQRKGVGMKIMLGLIDAAIDKGGRAVSLEVRTSNYGAQKMYERFGFKPVGVRRGYYIETGEDAIVMWVEGIRNPNYEEQLGSLRTSLATRFRG